VKLDVTQRLTLLWSVLFLTALAVFAAFAAAFVDRSAQVALDKRLLAQAALAAGSIDQGKARLDADLPMPQLPGFSLVVYKNGSLVQVAGAAPPRRKLRDAATLPLGVPVTIASPASYRVVVHAHCLRGRTHRPILHPFHGADPGRARPARRDLQRDAREPPA
jgi:hypothetical protein